MKQVKKTADYTIYQKRNGRYAVKAEGEMVHGEAKAKILHDEGLITLGGVKEIVAEEEIGGEIPEDESETPDE